MSIRPSAGSRAAPPRGEPSGRSGRDLGLALVVIATAQLMVVLDAVLGYSALRAGVAFLPFAGTMVVASGVASRLLTRTGTRPPLLAGAAVAAGGMYWFSHVSVRTTYLSGLLGPSLVTAAGLGLLFVPLSLLALDRVRAEDSGLAAGLLNVGQQVGGAIGLAALGTVAWTAVASSARAQLTAAARSGRSLASAQVPVAIYHDALAMGIARGFESRGGSGAGWVPALATGTHPQTARSCPSSAPDNTWPSAGRCSCGSVSSPRTSSAYRRRSTWVPVARQSRCEKLHRSVLLCRARNLPETTPYVASPRLTTHSSTVLLTCAVVGEGRYCTALRTARASIVRRGSPA
jgi:Major Facilitator Superfamily